MHVRGDPDMRGGTCHSLSCIHATMGRSSTATEPPSMITELRRYRIAPGRMDTWLAFFGEVLIESKRHAIRVDYAGVDPETDTFVWLRTFDDEADRVARKRAFYASDWWVERETYAMAHVLEYDVTFLQTAVVREAGNAVPIARPTDGAMPGAEGDAPPDGWIRSRRATFVREQTDPGHA
jgi:hypothetical protein